MRKLLVEKIPRITRNRRKLEEELSVKITNRGKEVFIDGAGEDEFVAEKIIEALDFGFPFQISLSLKNEDVMFEILNLKDYTHSRDMGRIRSRIIGTQGGTLKTLSDLSTCALELKDNKVGIIGNVVNIKAAQEAVISIVKGAKQSNVYTGLEKSRPEDAVDLGLKKEFKDLN